MDSILDLLIVEISNVLGISPDEVRSRFTKEELEVLLNGSLCEPESETTLLLPGINEIPCENLGIPDLLPPEATDLLDDLQKQAEETQKNDLGKKCVDQVSEVNKVVEKQIEEYNKHRILLEKLIEYRDNYFVIGIYFQERSKEASKFLNEFQPILEELKRLETRSSSLDTQLDEVQGQITQLVASIEYNPLDYQALVDKKTNISSEIIEVRNEIEQQRIYLQQKEISFPIFNESYVKKLIEYSEGEQNSQNYSEYLKHAVNNYFTDADYNDLDRALSDYSELITSRSRKSSIDTIQQLLQQSYFKFSLKFPQLQSFIISKEEVNRENGERFEVKTNFPILENPLLEKNSFFISNSIFDLSEFTQITERPPQGRIYAQYYNLFEDPINNFFTISERGLTENVALVDPQLKGTGAETKREASKNYYVQDLTRLQDFYNTFETAFENRKNEFRARVIQPGQEEIRSLLSTIARKEVQLALAISGVNSRLPEDSTVLKSTIESINRQNNEFATGVLELDEEIDRIRLKVEELKPEPAKIKNRLKEYSPECFSKIDDEIKDCGDTAQKLGSDPFFVNTINGTDPLLPNNNQLCYWKEFSKIINRVGLLPIPNLKAPAQLRYWPVGLVIPYPGGVVKIPLPIVWVPLTVISTPAGNIVIFLTVNGVFISPVVFFTSSSGFKQHILTVKGSSEKFGFSVQDEAFKSGLRTSLGLLSLKEKAKRLSQDATSGEYSQFSEKEKTNIIQAKQTLEESKKIAAETNNVTRSLKIKKELANFTQLISSETSLEIASKFLDKDETPSDAIEQAKTALNQRLDEIGQPELKSINRLKKKITDRYDDILSDLKSALELGDTEKANELREKSKVDGFSLDEKISAITEDLKSFYDKITFPKITIPKDKSKIDPALNPINELILAISEYTSIYRTQFFSSENLKIGKLLNVQLLKIEPKIKEKSKDLPTKEGKIDIVENLEEIKSFLIDVNQEVIDFITGKGTKDEASLAAEIKDLEKKIETEQDPVKKIKLQEELDSANQDLSDTLEKNANKRFLGITSALLIAQGQLKVDFDPFSPCCLKKKIEFQPDEFSPAILAILSAGNLLSSYISSLDSVQLKKFLGNRDQVSRDDMISAFGEIIKNVIPKDLSIPTPAVNPISLLNSVSGAFLSLFEPKASNLAAQPQAPSVIVIDLNILKAPLLELLIGFLLDSMPRPGLDSQPKDSDIPAKDRPKTGEISSDAKLSSDIVLINCEPDTSNDSILSDGYFSTDQIEKNKELKSKDSKSSINLYKPSSITLRTNRDILPAFQTLSSDFLSINGADLTTILKSFIDLKLDAVSSLIDSFYRPISSIKGKKEVNLNIVEDAQYKTPPHGPPAFTLFSTYTKIKQELPSSFNYGLFDLDLLKSAIEKLEPVLKPLGEIAPILVATAGAADSIFPSARVPSFDPDSLTVKTKDLKAATSALRKLHPILNQDDIPPWERLSSKNLLFMLFADEFISVGADQVGFFRSFV